MRSVTPNDWTEIALGAEIENKGEILVRGDAEVTVYVRQGDREMILGTGYEVKGRVFSDHIIIVTCRVPDARAFLHGTERPVYRATGAPFTNMDKREMTSPYYDDVRRFVRLQQLQIADQTRRLLEENAKQKRIRVRAGLEEAEPEETEEETAEEQTTEVVEETAAE